MIEQPESWPCYPFLPMTHRTKMDGPLPLPGLLYEKTGLTVYEANLYDVPAYGGSMTEAEFLACAQHIYASIHTLLEEWRID